MSPMEAEAEPPTKLVRYHLYFPPVLFMCTLPHESNIWERDFYSLTTVNRFVR